MIKYVWLFTALMIVDCLIGGTSARSATSTMQHQHANELTRGVSSASSENETEQLSVSPSWLAADTWKDLAMIYKIYKQCADENLSVCLKVKLLTGLERMAQKAKSLKLVDGVQFIKNDDSVEVITTSPRTEQDIEAVLPRALAAKESVLNSMIFKKLAKFLQHHSLQIKFPDLRNVDQHSAVESRKKKDKKGGGGAYIMIPLLLGGTFVPIAYGALAMLAGKALIVSKLALVLASIIGIKKLLSGHGKEQSHEVVVSSGGHSGWGRDMDLAYSGWKPGKEISRQTM